VSRALRRYEVAAGIVWTGSQVLIARRHDHDHQGGRWEFPGGKRRGSETIEQCLQRELLEEIGIEVDAGPLWRALTHVYPDRAVSLYFYLCENVRGTPRAIECSEVRWIPPDALVQLPFVEGDRPILPDLARDLTLLPAPAAGPHPRSRS
jgi:8-oxo-dGTP diphosphatase